MLWKQDQEIKLKQLNHFSINLVSLTKLVCPDEKVVIDKLSQQNTTSAFQINAPWILNTGEGKTWLLTLWLCFNTLPKIILKNLIWFIASLKKVNNKQLATCKTLYLVFSGNYVKLSDLFFLHFFFTVLLRTTRTENIKKFDLKFQWQWIQKCISYIWKALRPRYQRQSIKSYWTFYKPLQSMASSSQNEFVKKWSKFLLKWKRSTRRSDHSCIFLIQ